MQRDAFVDKNKLGKKQLRVRFGSEINVETISISINFLGVTQRETISTRNIIAIINLISLNSLNCFIIAAKTYLCSYVFILWSDLESSRMCLWNKKPIPLFGARSNVYHPCSTYTSVRKWHKIHNQFFIQLFFLCI